MQTSESASPFRMSGAYAVYDSFIIVLFFFFFQAEDGIRDFHVTGVQTCALPIFRVGTLLEGRFGGRARPLDVLAEVLGQRLQPFQMAGERGGPALVDLSDPSIGGRPAGRTNERGRHRRAHGQRRREDRPRTASRDRERHVAPLFSSAEGINYEG